jgi:hypothetical protein
MVINKLTGVYIEHYFINNAYTIAKSLNNNNTEKRYQESIQ